ncbi:MAG: hypothetical protein V1899_04130 [Planctomycetota bacterium]
MSLKLGEMLVAKKLIAESQLKTALDTQRQIGGKLGTILVKFQYLNETQLSKFLGEQLKIPVLRLSDLVVESKVSALVEVELCEKHQFLPLRKNGDSLQVAIVDPMDLDATDELHFLTGLRIELAVVSHADLMRAIDYYFRGKLCPEIHESEVAKGVASGQYPAVRAGTRVSPQLALQALTDLLIEKKLITREELLARLEKKE